MIPDIDLTCPMTMQLHSTPWRMHAQSTTAGLRVHYMRVNELAESDRSAWRDLEQNSQVENPFLSQNFVLPACKHLPHLPEPMLIVISRGHEWLGMGLFETVSPNRHLPVPHLRAWRSPHTFLQGMLLRRGEEQTALRAFWSFLQTGEHVWHAVEFSLLSHDSLDTQLLNQTAGEQGVEALQGPTHSRACLNLRGRNQEQLLDGISSRRQRSLRQAWNWLNRQGEIDFRFQRDLRQLTTGCQRFLELEATGWKAEKQSALLSSAGNTRFFREMTYRFGEAGRLMLAELTCDGKVIGSVVHLSAGKSSYAFKLGWDVELARGCPGFQLKAQTLYHATTQLTGLEMIDSCACPGSFIEHIWPDRREYSSRLYLTSRVGSVAAHLIGTIRWIRNCGRRLIPGHVTLQEPDDV